ncbi:TPA: hypothetical protein ACH3X1_016797 [Trebouxia sp. C0004]
MRSSAYKTSGTITPISLGASMSAVSSKRFSSPSTYKPNRVGLSGHPCFTPMRHLKMAEMPCDDRTAALSCAYRDLMMSRILPWTPSSSSTCHSTARGTVSNAFLKSMKQQYNLPAFPFCLDCFCFSISDLKMNMLSVVRKSFLKPACPLALTACSSAQDAIFCSSIIANSLATTEPTVMPL